MPRTKREPPVRIREIRDPGDGALRPAYDLLSRTFPLSERVPYREWVDSLEERMAGMWTDTAWHLLVAERGDHVVGLVSGTYVGNVNVGVIGYLAITPAARGLGLGSRLRNRLREAFKRDAVRVCNRNLSGILGEVGSANPWLKLLARNPRVLVLDVDYYQPRLYPSDEPSPFMVYLECTDGVRRSIPVPELKRILYAVWRRVYRVRRPLEHPAFRAMLRSLRGRRRVGRRSLAAGRRHR